MAEDGIARRFIGAWRYVGQMVDGQPGTARGADPKGIIVYDATGQMVCHVAPGRGAANPGHTAYFGTWTIDERARTVTHHKQGAVPPDDGSAVVRAFEFDGDRLILRPAETRATEIIWERIK
jgi:hypothetical protein